MTMSPTSSLLVSSCSVASTTAAGTISQMARGLLSFLTKSSSDVEPVAPSPASCFTVAGAAVVNDALVAVLLQAAHHVGAHPAESDHAQLHCVRSSVRSIDGE